MNKYNLINSKYNEILIFFFMFFIMYFGRDTLTSSSVVGFYTSQFISLGIVLCLGIIFILNNRKNIKNIILDIRIKLAIIITLVFCLPMLIKQDFQLMYLSILLCIYIAIFLSFILSIEKIACYFCIIISLLSVYSLFTTYFLKSLALNDVINIPTFQNPSGNLFFNFIFSYVFVDPSYLRNYSIFREPGVFQFFLLLALYLNFNITKYNKKIKYIVMLILTITLLSTFSTSGFIALIFLYFYFFLKEKVYLNKKIMRSLIIMILVMILVLVIVIRNNNSLYWTVYAQFYKLFNLNESMAPRLASIFVNLKLFFSNILVGRDVSTVLYSIDHNTSSTLILFAMCGILAGTFHVLTWFSFIKVYKKNTIIQSVILFIAFFSSFNTQNLITNIYFWLFPVLTFIQCIIYCERENFRGGLLDESFVD